MNTKLGLLGIAALLMAFPGCANEGDGDDSSAVSTRPDGLSEAIAKAEQGPIVSITHGQGPGIDKQATGHGTRLIAEEGRPLRNPNASYRIEVKTGAMDSAGTSAKVYLTMCSSGSGTWSCVKYHLDNVGTHDDFEKGQLDEFKSVGVDLGGPIEWIRIEHDNGGDKPGWFAEYVAVTDELRRIRRTCNVQQWLATSEAPNRTFAEVNCS